ncbi:MAG: AAA family ATPase [Holosporales bacterium]|jgi:hypothetical protein|nr:AAA family ATPase [Holosporales bacterium]
MRFVTLLGHEEQEQRLARALEHNALASSLLIAGPAGIGKTLFAKKLACALLSYDGTSPTNAKTLTSLCSPAVAQRICEGTHPDLVISTPSSEESAIDQMRHVLAKIYIKPAMARFKVVIFEEAETLNRNAANALLKTLEEPPVDTFMVLTSSYAESLLPTIRSRCLRVGLGPLSPTVMTTVLKKLQITLPAALLSLCDGSPGTALMLHSRAETHARFLKALEDNSLTTAKIFAEEEDVWPLFSWFACHALHQATCAETVETAEVPVLRAHAAALWPEVIRKIVQADRLNLDKKSVILWFFCSLRESLRRRAYA